jgi:hypothetical protein
MVGGNYMNSSVSRICKVKMHTFSPNILGVFLFWSLCFIMFQFTT